VDGNKLCDLDYADDIAPIETSQMSMQLMTEQVEKISRRVGLHECRRMQDYGEQ